ncbi:MAG TPA: TetR/AcrR family transcriptional regulator [Allosphingosinicella sp.]|jgi:AcrR family transcriptional regulator
MKEAAATVCKGRPREFCVDEALAAALRVFWSKGYEGASLTDLTEAMGITRPSLYAAFGNKQALFSKALDLYEREKLAYVDKALSAPTARGVAERLLRGALEMMTNPAEPRGCLGVIGASTCGAEAESIRAEVVERRMPSHRALIARLERAKEEGDLPASADPTGLAGWLSAIMAGLSVQAGAGVQKGDLERLIETSLLMWPSA